MLLEDYFGKGAISKHLCPVIATNCSFGNDILIVHSRWQAFSFVRQRGCSLLSPLFPVLEEGKPKETLQHRSRKKKKGSLAEAIFPDVFILCTICRSQRRNSVPQLSLSTEEPGCAFGDKCLCGKQGARTRTSP